MGMAKNQFSTKHTDSIRDESEFDVDADDDDDAISNYFVIKIIDK